MASLQALLLSLATLGQGGETVLLDFTAPWCPPCQRVAPTVHQLAAEGYPVKQIDYDSHPDLVRKYRVSSIPCFVMLVDGKVAAREVGPLSRGQLVQMMALAKPAANSSPPAANTEVAGNRRRTPWLGGPSANDSSNNRSAAQPASTFAAQSPDEVDPFTRARGAQTPFAGQQFAADTSINASSAANAQPVSAQPVNIEQLILSATVRIKVQDPDGHSYGTGTIVHQTQGKALVLTCAHLFRDSGGEGKLTIDLFGGSRRHGIPARLLDYDLDLDVALLVVEPNEELQVAPVALNSYQAAPGQPVYSSGCSHGDDATVISCQVTSINKYLGPPNIQASGQPVQGRSGGGLFDAAGRLIGVCNAADPEDREGLYAALGTIHMLLAEHDLSYVASNDAPLSNPASASSPMSSVAGSSEAGSAVAGGSSAAQAAAGSLAQSESAVSDVDLAAVPRMSQQPPANPFSAAADSFSYDGVVTGIARDRTETTETNFADSTEIICLIRSQRDPAADPRVVVISNASPELVQWLAEQGATAGEPHLTTQKVHKVNQSQLWEPVLRVPSPSADGGFSSPMARSASSASMAAPQRTARVPDATQPPATTQPATTMPATTPGRRDVPWRPASVNRDPTIVR